MHKAVLRQVGGSVMMALPPPVLEMLQLRAGSTVGVVVEAGRLLIEPQRKPRYALADLLAASDFSQGPDAEDRAWLDAPAVGRESI